MWLISYICIIVCTLNDFKTSGNNILWIRGMSTFSAIDQKRKISIKKASIARLWNKEFYLCFCIFGICLWLNKLSISTYNNNDLLTTRFCKYRYCIALNYLCDSKMDMWKEDVMARYRKMRLHRSFITKIIFS